jgi:replicative DNA helicase
MPNKEQFERLACEQASIDATKIKRRTLTGDDTSALFSAMNYIATLPIFIDDDATVTPQDLRARALRQHSRTPLGLIVIDYLQLIAPPRAMVRDTRERQVTVTAEALKALAKELNIPVVALAQLNRSLEERPDRRPRLSDLRESGGIEQSADLVIFIYRDDYYNKDSDDKGIAELIVAKQRGGDTRTAYTRWIATLTRFQDLTEEELEEIDGRKAAPNNIIKFRPKKGDRA